MKKRSYEPPRLLLAAASLGPGGRVPRDRMLEVVERFREPESLAVTLSKGLDAGAEGVLATPTTALTAALAELDRTVPMFALLPDLPRTGRHDLEPGRLDPLGGAGRGHGGMGTAWTRFSQAWALKHRDFGALVRVQIEADAGRIPRRALAGIVIAAGVTDLALAAGQRRFFERLVRFIHGRFRVRAAFETLNLGVLLARLREWEVRPDFVVGPVNPRGVMMKPSFAASLDEMGRSQVPVVATQLRATGLTTLEEGARFALQQGALGLAPDLADMDDVGAELGRLRSWREEKVRLEGSKRA
jgi:hypothetical protein